MKGKINDRTGETVFVFATVCEAEAFVEGVNCANDGQFNVSPIEEDFEGDFTVIITGPLTHTKKSHQD